MKLRVAPLYAKMWRQVSTVTAHPDYTGMVEGRDEHWALWATLPSCRRVETYPLGFGYIPPDGAFIPPIEMPTYIQPRGEP